MSYHSLIQARYFTCTAVLFDDNRTYRDLCATVFNLILCKMLHIFKVLGRLDGCLTDGLDGVGSTPASFARCHEFKS